MDENKELWNKCAAFHGHVCGGRTIGGKAALYAIELLDLKLGNLWINTHAAYGATTKNESSCLQM